MTPKLWNVALIGGGFVLICAGIQQWRANQGPEETVLKFLEAVKTGDRAVAQQLMTFDLRQQVKNRGDEFDAAWAAPPPGDGDRLAYAIEVLTVQGDKAIAKTLFRQGRIPFLNSKIHLRKTRTGLWKIARVDNHMNLAWRMRENERLAHNLREALKDLPGAQIAEEPASQRKLR